MDLTISHEHLADSMTVVRPDEINMYTASMLREILVDLIVHQGRIFLILDMTELVGRVDSTGLNVLVGALKRTQAQGGGVALVGLPEHVSKVFRTYGMTTVFPAFETVVDAEVGLPLVANARRRMKVAG
ncbi:STAS domain-containing protein [Streptomyces sp. NPDC004533]|uniref:STAS domain-containing protein n=1 Tax=Streptomyces sp. NPDC004533 TaxID=3154278 RepID=UPI0033A71A29